MQLYSNESIKATTEVFEYPFGTIDWTIYGDSCGQDNNEKVSINLNTCSDDEFNCVDGSCINISNRCDGKTDCADKTGNYGGLGYSILLLLNLCVCP